MRALGALAVLAAVAPAAAGPFLVPVTAPNGVFPLLDARTIAVSPEGTHVYAGGGDTLVVLDRDPGTGRITLVETHTDGAGGDDGLAGIAAIAISPDGAHLYAAGHDEDAIAVFTRTPATGALVLSEVVRDGVGGVDGLAGVDALIIGGNGAHVYVAGDGDDSVTLFARDAGTGALTFVELHRDGVGGVTQISGNASLALAPDGTDLYMGSVVPFADVGRLGQFRRDVTTGALTFAGPVPDAFTLFSPESAPVVVPDGTLLLFAGSQAFDRDLATGTLSPSTAFGAFGLSPHRPREMITDVAGSVFYASNAWGDTLDATWRDPYSNSFGHLDGLFLGEEGVSLAPDGRHVYAVGNDEVTAVRVACAPIVIKARMTIKAFLDPPGDDLLKLKGEVITRPGTFASLDPVGTGMRFVLEDGAAPDPDVDATLPAVAFGGKGTAGWKLDGSGTAWTYIDSTGGAPIAGISRVKIQDRSALLPGQLRIMLKGRDATYPVDVANATFVPRVRLEFGPETCVATAFQAITTDPQYDCGIKEASSKLSCRLPF